MRALSIFILSFCLGFLSCKDVPLDADPIAIPTVSYEYLTYPKSAVHIPDSLNLVFQNNFFRPWISPPQTLLSTLNVLPGKEPAYLTQYLEDDEWYGENKQPHRKWQREVIAQNIDTTGFPNFVKRAITIAHTDLRRVPTNRPGFDLYSKAGEGYPFDYFQETNLWANTPVLIAHISKDKQWCYVISPYYKGWVAFHDLALVDDVFVETWLHQDFCQPISDQVILADNTSHYAINAKIGMVLPYGKIVDRPDTLSVFYASSDENKNAHMLKALVAKTDVAVKGFAFNQTNLSNLVSNLVGKPYGWGGYLENRDCSSMIRDLLGTYGIWLPRDSKDQMDIGHTYTFPKTSDEKIALIKEKGIPFFTILRKKGHNMLYVGNAPNGDPLILHAIWGLKTSYTNKQLADFLNKYPIEGIHQEADGQLKGRHIIGETVITSVTIGTGESGVAVPLIDEIYAMTNVLER